MNDPAQTAFEAVRALHPALTLKMAQAVIAAYEGNPVFLTHVEKADIGKAVHNWDAGPKDIVNDAFEEIAKRFIVRRKTRPGGG